MQMKKNGSAWDVWEACSVIGEVRRVPQNPAYGRGSGPVSGEVLVWGAFFRDGRRIGMDFRTRRSAADAVLTAHKRLKADAPNPGISGENE